MDFCGSNALAVTKRLSWRSLARREDFALHAVKRMAETSAHLVDSVLPKHPYRQFVISLPYPLRSERIATAHCAGAVRSG